MKPKYGIFINLNEDDKDLLNRVKETKVSLVDIFRIGLETISQMQKNKSKK